MDLWTICYSIRSPYTLMYETGGKAFCELACCVCSVSNDVTPSVTLAGTASGRIQNEIHDMTTIRHVGMYV